MSAAPTENILKRFDLSGKTALVTGGNQGIGEALCWALAQAGAQVIIAARTLPRSEKVAAALAEAGYQASAVRLDVTDPEQIESTVASIKDPIDILVNNAGICYHDEASEKIAPERFTDVVNVNLNGVWFCTQAVAKRMIARGSGSIINTGSMSGIIVNRPQWQAAYNASKAAVHQLTRSLAAEWAPHKVRVNAIAPGYIRTDMADVDDPAFKPRWVDDAPMQRAGNPDELAPAVIYLASEASSFTTGEVITIDGGYTLF